MRLSKAHCRDHGGSHLQQPAGEGEVVKLVRLWAPIHGKLVIFVDAGVVVSVAGSDRGAAARSLGKIWETAQNPRAT